MPAFSAPGELTSLQGAITRLNGYHPQHEKTNSQIVIHIPSSSLTRLNGSYIPKWLSTSTPEELTNSDAFKWLIHAKMAHTDAMAVTRQNDELTL